MGRINSKWTAQLLYFVVLWGFVIGMPANVKALCGYPNECETQQCALICACYPADLDWGYCFSCDPWSFYNSAYGQATIYTGNDGCDSPIYCDFQEYVRCLY